MDAKVTDVFVNLIIHKTADTRLGNHYPAFTTTSQSHFWEQIQSASASQTTISALRPFYELTAFPEKGRKNDYFLPVSFVSFAFAFASAAFFSASFISF